MPASFSTFSDLVSTFRLTPPDSTDGWEREELSPRLLNWTDRPQPSALPGLWYRQETAVSISALEKKIAHWMLRLGLPSSDDAVSSVLGTIAMMKETGSELVPTLTEIKKQIRIVDATHTYVLPGLHGEGWTGRLVWQGFSFERLNSKKLAYLCDKAKAPDLAISAARLEGLPSFRTPVFKRTILDFADLCSRFRTSPAIQKYGVELLASYLEAACNLSVDAMWEAVEDAFLLPNALGLSLFNFSDLRWLPTTEVWTNYSGLGRSGKMNWIVKQVTMHPLNVPNFEQAEKSLTALAQVHRFTEVRKSRLYPLLEIVSRSLARSTYHLSGERVDESFLFLIIAIEQVFSEKGRTTQFVASRTAVVAHHHLKMGYPETKKHVGALYDVRSRFVHQGKPATIEDRLAANTLGGIVVRCLLRLCLIPDAAKDDFHEAWLKRLDYLVASIDAGKPLLEADLLENGIIDQASK